MTDDEVFTRFADVAIDRDNIEHYRGLATRKLLINRCGDCGYWIYPHRPICPECWSWNIKPTEVSGYGKIFMFTLIQQLRDPRSQILEPVPVAAVELVEQDGLRYLAQIVNCAYEEISLDMVVSLTWQGETGSEMPAFEPIRNQEVI